MIGELRIEVSSNLKFLIEYLLAWLKARSLNKGNMGLISRQKRKYGFCKAVTPDVITQCLVTLTCSNSL